MVNTLAEEVLERIDREIPLSFGAIERIAKKELPNSDSSEFMQLIFQLGKRMDRKGVTPSYTDKEAFTIVFGALTANSKTRGPSSEETKTSSTALRILTNRMWSMEPAMATTLIEQTANFVSGHHVDGGVAI